MGLILLEALGALLLLVVIVWWTMFSGRKGGELSAPDEPKSGDHQPENIQNKTVHSPEKQG